MLSKGFKVFVGGLNYNTTDRSLAAYFERYGPLEDYIVIKTSEHKSRGFGFVIFQNVSLKVILHLSFHISYPLLFSFEDIALKCSGH